MNSHFRLTQEELEKKYHLFGEYIGDLPSHSRRRSRMDSFSLDTQQQQFVYLNKLSSIFYNGLKLPAPQFFVSTHPDKFSYKKSFNAKEVSLYSDRKLYRPQLYPIVSFLHGRSQRRNQSSRNSRQIMLEMHLLKPSLVTGSGNNDFLEEHEFGKMRKDMFSRSFESEHSIAFYNPESKENLGPIFQSHTFRDSIYIQPTFHWECLAYNPENHFYHISEIRDSLDYQLFKEFWPIFDWDGTGSRHLFLPASPKFTL